MGGYKRLRTLAAHALAALVLTAPAVGHAFVISAATDDDHGAGQSLSVNGELVTMTIVSAKAGYDNVISLASDPPGSGISCDTVPRGFTVPLGRFTTPTDLVLSLATPVGDLWTTGSGADNGDVVAHARLKLVGADTVRVEWEDMAGGGDLDYDDCVVTLQITRIER